MNFLSLLPILSTLIDRIFPDKEKQDQAKIEMEKVLVQAEAQRAEAEAKKVEAQSKVIVAEARSESYAARNWRPHLMYALMLIIPYNWILAPILQSIGLGVVVFPIPPEFWTLLTVGLGGYIGNDMVTTYSDAKFNNKKFFDVVRERLFVKGMSQDQVDALNEAINKAKK